MVSYGGGTGYVAYTGYYDGIGWYYNSRVSDAIMSNGGPNDATYPVNGSISRATGDIVFTSQSTSAEAGSTASNQQAQLRKAESVVEVLRSHPVARSALPKLGTTGALAVTPIPASQAVESVGGVDYDFPLKAGYSSSQPGDTLSFTVFRSAATARTTARKGYGPAAVDHHDLSGLSYLAYCRTAGAAADNDVIAKCDVIVGRVLIESTGDESATEPAADLSTAARLGRAGVAYLVRLAGRDP